ncbi:MAG: glutamate-cysteine ligase family protein, partial [Candidatus Methanoperedens sp.]|nr:glutamate-cysteine ligase family protein [Candidatus Methanoperedens sp.]
MTIGTEHEYSINDRNFNPLPISDVILSKIAGSVKNEVSFGEVTLSKELQKTVLEFIPDHPGDSLFELERQIYSGIRRFYLQFGDRYHLLGLGMHPTLTLDKTAVWNHDEKEYYEVYDRLFNIRQHGWLNIQALQVNLSYSNDEELIYLYNRIRSLLPYLIAVSASSPFVEGKVTGSMDNRLLFYRKNQKEIPQICNRIIPETISEVNDYLEN